MKRPTLFPSIGDLLASPTIKPWVDRLQPTAVIAIAHGVLQESYDEMKSVATEFRMPDFSELTARILARLSDREKLIARPAINASGIFFHPECGSPQPASRVVEQTLAAIGSVPSPVIAESLLRELTGAEEVIVLNDYASAHLASLLALGAPEWAGLVVSRRDVREGVHGFRLFELLESFGTSCVIDIGTVDGTVTGDYVAAFEATPAPDFVYFNRSTRNGFESTLSPSDLADVLAQARERGVVSILDWECAALGDLSAVIPALPTVAATIAEGFDLVVFPGGGLIGGPDVGIVAGKKTLIERMRGHVLTRAFRPERSVMAALQATLSLYIDRDCPAEETIPILELLHTSEDNLANRAERIARQLEGCPDIARVHLERMAASLYPGDWLRVLPAPAIVIVPRHVDAEEMQAALFARTPPVATRLVPFEAVPDALRSALPAGKRSAALAILLQTVPPRLDMQILDAFAKPANEARPTLPKPVDRP